MTARETPAGETSAAAPMNLDPLAPARRASTILLIVGFALATFGGVTVTMALSLDQLRADPLKADMLQGLDQAEAGVVLGVVGGLIACYGLCLIIAGCGARRGGLIWLIIAGVVLIAGALVAVLQIVVAVLMRPAEALIPAGFVYAAVMALRALFAAFGNAHWAERRQPTGWAPPRFQYPSN